MSARNTAAVIRERNDHDAATVLAVVLAIAAQDVVEGGPAPVGPRSIWSDPAYRLRATNPSPAGWWASAMPR